MLSVHRETIKVSLHLEPSLLLSDSMNRNLHVFLGVTQARKIYLFRWNDLHLNSILRGSCELTLLWERNTAWKSREWNIGIAWSIPKAWRLCITFSCQWSYSRYFIEDLIKIFSFLWDYCSFKKPFSLAEEKFVFNEIIIYCFTAHGSYKYFTKILLRAFNY